MNNDLTSRLSQYMGSQAFDDLCEAFVEQLTYGKRGLHPSAASAWNTYNQQGKAVSGLNGIQPGDLVYFHDPNQSNGHTGIYTGNGKFTSATYNGVQNNDVNQWVNSTGQQLLGYVPQGHSAQSLGQSINTQTNNYLSDAQNTLSDMNTGKIPWDDNARARANTVLRSQNPQQAPTSNFGQQMANFSQVWNMTHGTPLSAYM